MPLGRAEGCAGGPRSGGASPGWGQSVGGALRQLEVDRPRWLQVARSIGAGDWFDESERRGELRREGACELVRFASRCPRLRELVLRNFDFGRVGNTTLDLPHLPSVRVLEWTHRFSSDIEPASQAALLPLMPNLGSLELTAYDPSITLSKIFTHFTRLKIGNVRPGNFEVFTTFLHHSCPSIHTLELWEFPYNNEDLTSTIEHLPHLRSPSIQYIPLRQVSWTFRRVDPVTGQSPHTAYDSPHESLLSLLPTTSLTHLYLPFPTHPSYLESLPPTLTSLGMDVAEHTDPKALREMMRDTLRNLVARRATNLPVLTRLVVHAHIAARLDELNAVWADGRAAGLDIVCVAE